MRTTGRRIRNSALLMDPQGKQITTVGKGGFVKIWEVPVDNDAD